jgi:hypothetical protein
MKIRGNLGAILLFAVVLMVCGSVANATPMIYITDGTNIVSITDNGTGDENSVAGTIQFSDPVGDWTVSGTAVSNGSATNPSLDLNSLDISSTSTGTPPNLTIEFSDNGFSSPYPTSDFIMGIGGTTDGTVTYATYFSNTDNDLQLDTLIASVGPLLPGLYGSFSGGSSGAFSPSSPYSLTQVITVSSPAGTSMETSYDARLQASPVPEPTSLILLGSSLVGLVLYRRRRS